MNRGQLWSTRRKSFLTIVNALIMCMGATIVSYPSRRTCVYKLTHRADGVRAVFIGDGDPRAEGGTTV